MRIRRAPAVLSAAAVLGLVLSGCSGSSADPAATGTEQDGPLAEYLNAVYGGDMSQEEQQQQFAEQQEQSEALVASCMQEQGFEYTPATSTGGISTSDGSEYQPDDRDWVTQYGYGAVNSPFAEPSGPTEDYVDPNADYVAGLSESEQTAFYEALYGPTPSEDELADDGSYEYDWETAGCQGAAQHEVSGDELYDSDEFKPLFDAINDLYTDTSTGPEMTALDAEWAACMDTAGEPGFSTQADAQNSIYDALNEIYSATTSEDGTSSTEPDQAALDTLGEREIALALTDLDCREETDYKDRSAEINRDAEQQFVDDHKTELEALKAAAEQDGPP